MWKTASPHPQPPLLLALFAVVFTDVGDYIANTEDVTFSPGQTSFSFNVGIVDDNFVENTERFMIRAMLVSGDAAGVSITPGDATVDILDTDRE